VADQYVIETVDLRKQYDGVEALGGLDLRVEPGSIHGFLGKNGAGKTTTIKILLGMAFASGGSARVFGLPVGHPDKSVDIRRRTGFVGEDKDLYDSMTVEGIVRFTASFYPRWRSDLEQRYLARFELPPTRKVKTLSRGMRTKLALLLAVCRGAELLLLDEPTSGLDPAAIEEVLQTLVSHVAREEITVFFSSHQIGEVEQIADHVSIVDRGRTVVAGALDELRARFCRVQLVFENIAPNVSLHSPGVERVERDGRVMTVLSSRGADGVLDETRALSPSASEVLPVTLKEIFLNATERKV